MVVLSRVVEAKRRGPPGGVAHLGGCYLSKGLL